MKRKKHEITSITFTAGTDLDRKKSIAIQEVDGVKCVCVHKCRVIGELHFSTMDEKSLEIAIPYEHLYPLLARMDKLQK